MEKKFLFLICFLLVLFAGSCFAEGFMRGTNYVSWWYNQYESSESDASIALLKNSTNSKWVSILVTQYLDDLSDTTIEAIESKTPIDTGIVKAISKAHSLGMKVALKPHVDVGYYSSTWRGQISYSNEADWQNWFNSYKQFINYYAELAEANNVEMLVIGTELKGTSHRQSDWRSIITGIKTRYSGKIVYAANHDEYQDINWWDALDFIGIDAYFPLTTKCNPTVAEMQSGFEQHIASAASFASGFNKKILLTEIGFQSRDCTNTTPWWSSNDIDLQEQADAYNATLEVMKNNPAIAGAFWWNWLTSPNQGGNEDTDFTPHGKPAESVLAEYYAGKFVFDGNSQEIACNSNNDCGTDAWAGNPFCQNGNVYQNYRTYTCNNPGTANASCSYTDSSTIKQDCGDTSYEAWSTPYCNGNNIEKSRIVHNKGCASGACFENDTTEKQTVQACQYGCNNGTCNAEPADKTIWRFDNFYNPYKVFGSYTCDVKGTKPCPGELGWQGSKISFKFLLDANAELMEAVKFKFDIGYFISNVFVDIYAGRSKKKVASNVLVDKLVGFSVEFPSTVFVRGKTNYVTIVAKGVRVGYGKPSQAFVLSSVALENSRAYEKPFLNCPIMPIDGNYAFSWLPKDYNNSKFYLQVGYNAGFAKKTFIQATAKTNPMPISRQYKKMGEYAKTTSEGKIFARLYATDSFGRKAYSNSCAFNVDSVKVLDAADWLSQNAGTEVSMEKAYKSSKSLKAPVSIPWGLDQDLFVGIDLSGAFSEGLPSNLRGAIISAKISAPPKCGDKAWNKYFNKNYLQIHLRDAGNATVYYNKATLFSRSGWKTTKADLRKLDVTAAAAYIKIGIFGGCNGPFYIDDFSIEKDGKTYLYNFE